jgi:hypothetical protein
VKEALKELEEIRSDFKLYTPLEVVWDIDDLEKNPPWRDNISEDITDLYNYFITSDGDHLIELLYNALKKAENLNLDISIEAL